MQRCSCRCCCCRGLRRTAHVRGHQYRSRNGLPSPQRGHERRQCLPCAERRRRGRALPALEVLPDLPPSDLITIEAARIDVVDDPGCPDRAFALNLLVVGDAHATASIDVVITPARVALSLEPQVQDSATVITFATTGLIFSMSPPGWSMSTAPGRIWPARHGAVDAVRGTGSAARPCSKCVECQRWRRRGHA